MGQAAPASTRLTAINWADPANTMADMACVAATDRPLLIASAPKISPKGIAPMMRGKVSLAPARNSDNGEGVLVDMGLILVRDGVFVNYGVKIIRAYTVKQK